MNEELEKIANKISEYKSKTIINVLHIGGLLKEAKEQLSHGSWTAFLNDSRLKFTIRTAQRYIQLYNKYHYILHHPNPSIFSKLNYNKLLQLKNPDRFKQIVISENINEERLKEFIEYNTTQLSYNYDEPQEKSTRDLFGLNIFYIAGLFDGEGCLNIYHKGGKQFIFSMTISNNHLEILQDINVYFKFSGTIVKNTCSKLYFNQPTIIKDILRKMDLFIKKKQKGLMLKAINLYLENYEQHFQEILTLSIALNYLNSGQNAFDMKNAELAQYSLVSKLSQQSP